MVKYKIALFAFLLLVFNSCSTTNYTNRSITIDKNPVITNDIVVDIKVDVKKSVTATSSERETVELAKNEAYYNAITEQNIDIVVDPIFVITTTGGMSIAKLTGYAGYYSNPRTKTDAVKELQSIKLEDVTTFQRMFYPDLYQSKKQKTDELIKNRSINVLNSGLSSYKPIASTNTSSKKIEISVLNGENTFKSDSFGEIDNNGSAIAVSYDFNPNKKIGINSEMQYSFNSDYDHISKNLYLRYALFRKLNLVAGPSLIYFIDDVDGLNALNIGYALGANYNVGKRLSLKVRTSQFANVGSDSGSDISYSSLNFGVGYKF
jgi:hypothetical protein